MKSNEILKFFVWAVLLLFITGCGSDNKPLNTELNTMDSRNTDIIAPILFFDPEELTVRSGQSARLKLVANDNVGITTGPKVECSDGGMFELKNDLFTAPITRVPLEIVCHATASDAAGNSSNSTLSINILPERPVDSDQEAVFVYGNFSFDSVPINNKTASLDFEKTSSNPAANIMIKAIDNEGNILAKSLTDERGFFELALKKGLEVTLVATAEIHLQENVPWNVSILDNTKDNILHVFEGAKFSIGDTDIIKNLHANSGWNGTTYEGKRSAAPFAILSTINQGMEKILQINPDISFPQLKIYWSENNVPIPGAISAGFIGSSAYNGSGEIFLLGDAHSNTDEFDHHVILHEWTHFLEDVLARSDTIGGPHSQTSYLDPRVAFSEGFANAFSAILLNDPIYVDTFGIGSKDGIIIDLEENSVENAGWFSEASIQSVIYDIFDNIDDENDQVSFGISQIFNAILDPSYVESEELLTIFSYIEAFKRTNSVHQNGIDQLTINQGMFAVDVIGTGETNDGGVSSVLPLYKSTEIGGQPIVICSEIKFGTYNRLGNRAFIKVNIEKPASYTFSMKRSSGAIGKSPDFKIFKKGRLIGSGLLGNIDTQNSLVMAQINIGESGIYIIEAFDQNNITDRNAGNTCYEFMIEINKN